MKDFIEIGVIIGAHGIKGELKLKPYGEDMAALAGYPQLYDESGQAWEVQSCRFTPKGVILRLTAVIDRNQAESWIGQVIYVPATEMPALAAEEYYYHQLIGLPVYDPAGQILGQVAAVHNYGAGDILEITLAGQEKTKMVVFNQDNVPEVDLEGQRLTVVPEAMI